MSMKYCLLLFILFLVININGQEITTFNNRFNIVFVGIDNPIYVSGVCNCKNIIVTASNGKITQEGDCKYNLISRKPGNTWVKVYKIESHDTIEIANKEFRVQGFPNIHACIKGKHDCSIDKEFITSAIGIEAPVDNWEINLIYPVQSFDIVIIRGEEVCFKKSYSNYKFSDELINEFKKLEKGDLIFFYNITAKNVIDKTMELPPINFSIN